MAEAEPGGALLDDLQYESLNPEIACRQQKAGP